MYMIIHQLKLSTILILLTAVSLLFTGCGSGHDHGPTPVGMVLSANGSDLAIQDGTTITYLSGSSDAIEMTAGNVLSPITVTFLMEDGDRFTPDTNDGYSLRFSVTNGSVISINHPVTNEWTLSAEALSAGNSSLTFELWHVNHSDFVSRAFQVRVLNPSED